MKKVVAWFLISAMLLALPLTAFADGTSAGTPTGTSSESIPLSYTDGVFFAGNEWDMYTVSDSATNFCSVFQPLTSTGACGYVSLDAKYVDGETGKATQYGVMQYKGTNPDSYTLSYNVKLDADNYGQVWTFFYWQDTLANGRSMANSMKSAGYALRTTSDSQGVYFDVISYNATGAYSKYSTVVSGTSRYSADLLTDAAANTELAISLTWDSTAKLVTVSATRVDTSAALEAKFDLSAHANINVVTNPAGFAIMDAAAANKCAPLASIGNFKMKAADATEATDIPLSYTDGVFFAGNEWKMYTVSDSATNFCSVFQPLTSTGACGAVSLDSKYVDGETKKATQYGVMQYKGTNPDSYKLDYKVKLDADNYGQVWTYFYWQDTLANGRSMRNSMKSAGYAIRTTSDSQGVYFDVISYNATGAYSKYSTAVSGTSRYSADLLTGAAANTELALSLTWDSAKKIVTVSATRTDTSASLLASFDLSAHANINVVTKPSGFAIVDMAAANKCAPLASISDFQVTDLSKGFADLWTLSTVDGNFAATDGTNFTAGSDGWLSRNVSPATDVALAQYNKGVSYNYELTFDVKLDADNRGRLAIWNAWDGKVSGSHYGYMLNIATDGTGETLTLNYNIGRYDGSWSNGKSLVTAETVSNYSGHTFLRGLAGNAVLTVKITVQDNTITVNTSLKSDPTKTTGDIVIDFSGADEKNIRTHIDRSLGFLFMDNAMNAGGGAAGSTSVGNIVYTSKPGEDPGEPEEPDTNDYNAILNKNDYAWSGNVTVNTDNFKLYTMNALPYELFSISQDGWFYRNNANNETTSDETKGESYAFAQYQGVMDASDYKLTFSVKADKNNNFRFNVLTRWDDEEDKSFVNYKSQAGFRMYFYTEENKVFVRCYKTTWAWVTPVELTPNESALDLTGLTGENAEFAVTIVMKDDYVVSEIHLASDPTKTSGPVAFKLGNDATLWGKVDKTQGFCLMDSANELKYEPAQFGNFKLYAAKAPEIAQAPSGGDDPIEEDTGTREKKTTEAPTTEAPTTEAPVDEKKGGCSSSVTASAAVVMILSIGAGAIVTKKKKNVR